MNVKLNWHELAVWNLALYTFMAMNPFFRWIIPTEATYVFFIATTVVVSAHVPLKTSNYRLRIALLLFCFVAYITLPVFSYFILRIGHLLWFIPLFFFTFYDYKQLSDAFLKLRGIIVFFSIFTMIVWVLRAAGIELPYIWIYQSEQHFETMKHHRLYGLVVAVYSHGTAVQSGLGGLERASGPFTEPGHFGIFLGVFLLLGKFDLSRKYNRIFLLTGIMTLSPAFFYMVALGVFYKVINFQVINKSFRTLLIVASVFFMILLSNTFVGNQMYYLVYERTFGEVEKNPLDDRVGKSFLLTYEDFLKEGNIYTGVGWETSRVIDMPSNYRSFIYRFGYIGISLSVLLVSFIIFRNFLGYKHLLILLLGVVGILAHRYQYLLYPTFYAMLLLGISHLFYSKMEEVSLRVNEKI